MGKTKVIESHICSWGVCNLVGGAKGLCGLKCKGKFIGWSKPLINIVRRLGLLYALDSNNNYWLNKDHDLSLWVPHVIWLLPEITEQQEQACSVLFCVQRWGPVGLVIQSPRQSEKWAVLWTMRLWPGNTTLHNGLGHSSSANRINNDKNPGH